MPRKKKAKEKKAKSVGRPTDYTFQLGEEICNAISENKKSLKTLCGENTHWPDERTIRQWRRDKEEFSRMYIIAKQDQADLLAEEIIDIADDTTRDTLTKTNRDGDEYDVCNYEWINRSRVRIDTRKWLACKLFPKFYGDKIQTETTREIKTIQDIVDVYREFSESDRLLLIDELSRIHNVEKVEESNE